MKLLINPLGWTILLQIVILGILLRKLAGLVRHLVILLLGLTVLLTVASIPLFEHVFEPALAPGVTSSSKPPPRFIFVLGGGYLPGPTPEEDVLVVDSQSRSMRGIAFWRQHPSAKMVFSGSATGLTPNRPKGREGQIMAQIALFRGVLATAMVFESNFTNTCEHPMEALKLPGITPSTPIAIVTSRWHMRRAKPEFCRYFHHVQTVPVPPVHRSLTWDDFFPDPDASANSTTMLREVLGLFWYSLLNIFSAQDVLC